MLDRWKDWIAAFDQCCVDDRWDRLTPFLCEDVMYGVTGVPFACELRGIDRVLGGFRRSVQNFDRKCETRTWKALNIRVFEPTTIRADIFAGYKITDRPAVHFGVQGLWIFREDRLSAMFDLYDLAHHDTQAALQWLAENGGGLDPSYV